MLQGSNSQCVFNRQEVMAGQLSFAEADSNKLKSAEPQNQLGSLETNVSSYASLPESPVKVSKFDTRKRQLDVVLETDDTSESTNSQHSDDANEEPMSSYFNDDSGMEDHLNFLDQISKEMNAGCCDGSDLDLQRSARQLKKATKKSRKLCREATSTSIHLKSSEQLQMLVETIQELKSDRL